MITHAYYLAKALIPNVHCVDVLGLIGLTIMLLTFTFKIGFLLKVHVRPSLFTGRTEIHGLMYLLTMTIQRNQSYGMGSDSKNSLIFGIQTKPLCFQKMSQLLSNHYSIWNKCQFVWTILTSSVSYVLMVLYIGYHWTTIHERWSQKSSSDYSWRWLGST